MYPVKIKVADQGEEPQIVSDYEMIRETIMQNQQCHQGRSLSSNKAKTKFPGSKIRRGKTLGRIAKMNIKSVEDEIMEEMSGGEEEIS